MDGTAGHIPLSALRTTLDDGSARWLLDADGVPGRILVVAAGSTATFPLRLSQETLFRSRAMLFPHDWRDRRGAVRMSVTVADASGERSTLWTCTLHAGGGDSPRGAAVRCRLPRGAAALQLAVEREDSAPATSLERAIWVSPGLTDPGAPLPLPPVPVRAPVPPRAPATPASRPTPLISVLVPVHDPPIGMLDEAIASVTAQTFGEWDLCLVDDGSSDPDVIAALERRARSDPRIKLMRHETPRGISEATNTAMAHATGDYIALLDHDDTLTADALEHIAHRIAAEPDLDMIYTDEDTLVDGRQVWAHLKPGWSPDTLRTNGYTCHLGVYRRTLVQELGGFRSDFNGSQDVDMILRLTERSDRIAHIPRILYHWRAHAGSTAADAQSKPYAYVAARNAIESHLERIGMEAQVDFGPPGLYRVTHRVEPSTSVDLVLAVEHIDGLAQAAASWPFQAHASWTVTLAVPTHALDAARSALTDAGISQERITPIPTPVGQHPSAALAAAAAAGHAEHLVLMQTPAMGLTHDWLIRLLGYSAQPGIAAAGPVVLAPDGRIQQAGIAIPEGIPLHLLHGTRSSMDNLFGYGTSVYNVSAVSGILATPRITYHQLGGLDPTYGELALIDYCLRAGQENQRTVIVPDARLRATGPDPTTNDLPTLWRLRADWAQHHTHDPYYNPNYRTDRGDFRPVAEV
jgi:O-antigen biosynthesis protein